MYVSGYTYSTNFPTQNALQSSLSGGSDIFITKFTPGSSALLFSTYLGGSSNDQALAMIVDSTGNIYLTGDTQSPNFPVTATAYQSTLLGTDKCISYEGCSRRIHLGFFHAISGAVQTDQANAMAMDSAGNIYITGFTQSSNFPLLDSFQNVLGISGAGTCGSTNLINVPNNISAPTPSSLNSHPREFLPTLRSLGEATRIPAKALPLTPLGRPTWWAEPTRRISPPPPGPTSGYYGGSNTNSNAFVTKISPQDAPSVALSPQQINFGNQPLQSPSNAVTVTLTNEGSAALSISSITASGDFQQTNTCGTSVSGGGGTCTIQITFTPTSVGARDRSNHHYRQRGSWESRRLLRSRETGSLRAGHCSSPRPS